MAHCENCHREITEGTTYIYTMEHPMGGVETKDLCPACASEVIHAVKTALAERRKFVAQVNSHSEHLYDDIPGEVL